MSMTVQDVLDLPQLFEMQVRAGHQHLHRIVRWFYVAENESISEWISGGEIIFVGVNTIRDEANLLALLDQAQQRDVAAMVILTSPDFIPSIPESVIAKAEALALPLIEQPYRLKMVEVTHIIGTRLVEFSQLKRSAEDVVMQLLQGDFPSLDSIHMRAQHVNLPVFESHVIVVLKCVQPHTVNERDMLVYEKAFFQFKQSAYQLLEQWRKQQQQQFPVTRQSDQFHLVLSLEQLNEEEWQAHLMQLRQQLQDLAHDLQIYIGLSNPVQSAVAFQRGFWEACHAQEVAADLAAEQGVCHYRDLGLLKLLKAIPNKQLLQQFMQDCIGMLIEPERKHPYLLVETLDAWFKENGNVIATAQRLGIHRNTLNQRIQKIEALMGQSLTSAHFRLNAAVALLIWRMTHH